MIYICLWEKISSIIQNTDIDFVFCLHKQKCYIWSYKPNVALFLYGNNPDFYDFRISTTQWIFHME